MGWARRDGLGWVEDSPPDEWDDGQGGSYDLRGRDSALMAYCGWQPVTETPRPDDTDLGTTDRALRLVDGRVTVVWEPRPWTVGEHADRVAQAARLTTIEARLAALEALVLARIPAPAVTLEWDGGPVEPGGHRTIMGIEWINTSGAWLVAGPAVYPIGWRQATPPVTAVAWAAGQSVKADDLRSHNGTVYRCIQGHTTQAGWEPPAVPALWTAA